MDDSTKNMGMRSGTNYTLTPVGVLRTPFVTSGETPRQGLPRAASGEIEIFPAFEEGLTDIEQCRYLILLFWMDQARRDRLKATPPHKGTTHGVFVTRSPHRPNPIGLTVVKLLGRQGSILRVQGVDMIDGTPLLDIKPYVAELDSMPDASG
jgi:formylmethanofuran dehydrogenase subunit E